MGNTATVGLGAFGPVRNTDCTGGGAAGTRPRPFQLLDATDDDGAKVRVVVSTLVGDLPDGFSGGDDPPFFLDVSAGDKVYACVVWDVSGPTPGEVTSRTLGVGTSVPDDDTMAGTFYYQIGTIVDAGDSVGIRPSNLVYGPIDAVCYRLWFTSPKDFGVAWNAAN